MSPVIPDRTNASMPDLSKKLSPQNHGNINNSLKKIRVLRLISTEKFIRSFNTRYLLFNSIFIECTLDRDWKLTYKSPTRFTRWPILLSTITSMKY
ncbi:unnamed protein product [Rhizophagus irregularis]|nr:unnamed protein product [Rhizophagus irregularis]